MLGFFRKRQHNRLRDLLSAYVDGQTSVSETIYVERHLDSCGECRADLELLQDTVRLLRSLPELELPRSFALTQAPAPSKSSAPRMIWTVRLATSFAGLFLLALVLGDAFGLVTQSSNVERELAVSEFSAPSTQAGLASQPAPSSAPEEPNLPGLPGVQAEPPAQEPARASASQLPAQPIPSPSQPTAPAPSQPAPALPAMRPDFSESSVAQTPPPSAGAASDASQEASEPMIAAAVAPDTTTVSGASGESKTQATPPSLQGFAAESIRPSSEGFENVAPNVNQDDMPVEESFKTLATGAADAQEGDDGLMLPLRQLEAAAGGALVLLIVATIWASRRKRYV